MSSGRALIRQIFRRRSRPAALGCAGAVLHQTCEALVPLAIGLAVDSAVDNLSSTAIGLAVLGVLGLFVVLAAAGAFGYWLIDVTCLREAHHLRVASAADLLQVNGPRPERSSGELMSILTVDAKWASEVIRVAGWLVSATVGLVVSAVVLLRIDMLLGVGVLVVLPVLVFGMDRLGPWIERRTHARQQTGGLAAGVAAEFIAGLRPLRGFGGVPEAVRRYRRASRRSLDAAVDAATAGSVTTASGLLATGVLLVGIAAAAGAMAIQGRITIGELITVVAMASFLADPVRSIAAAVQQLAVSRASADRIGSLFAPAADEINGAATELAGDLQLDDVGVGGLSRLSLTVGAGELVGVTAVDPGMADAVSALVAGTRRPEQGAVRIGPTDLATVDTVAVRRQILVEPHVVHLFGATLAEALDADRGAPPDALLAAMTAAGAEDIAEDAGGAAPDPAVPDHTPPADRWLDRPLLDHGVNLSGGQRQRIALARALAADPPVLVLRDPLSAVDAVTEDRAARGIRNHRADGRHRTVVLTSSPLLLARCDRVLFIDADGGVLSDTYARLSDDPAYAAAVLR